MLQVKYILNNYTVGAKLKSVSAHVVAQKRIDKNHTMVILEVHEKELPLLQKLFGKDKKFEII